MMSRNRSRPDDELPDAVVRMYRESLDEDGLDFLRRGPRTAAERLAYAQRVHPEAYRRAEPAPPSAQEAFAQWGALDGRRYFVGSDRNLYLRSEDTAEPLYSSIRRGFETAVPGFQPSRFDDALAEMDAPRSDTGEELLHGAVGSDTLAPVTAAPTEWEPLYESGPLRMKEIASWSQSAIPEDATNIDPGLRKDILRHLRYEHQQGKLTRSEHALGQEVYAGIRWDRDAPPPHSADMEAEYLKRILDDPTIINAEKDWPLLPPEGRRAVLERVIRHLSDLSGFPMPEVSYDVIAGAEAVHRGDKNRIIFSSTPSNKTGLGSIPTAAHEATHALQRHLGRLWVSGDLPAADPNYSAGEWAALTDPFKLVPSDRGTGPYTEQLREIWADWLGKQVRQGFYDRQGGTKP